MTCAKDFGVTDAPIDFGTEAGLKELVTHELGESEGVELSEPHIAESEPEEDENLATEGSDEYLSGASEEAPLNEGNEELEGLLTPEDEAPYPGA